MNHRVEALPTENAIQRLRITHVSLEKRWHAASDSLNAFQHRGLTVAKVIEDRDLMPGRDQFDAGMGSDVSGATGNEERGHELIRASMTSL